MRATASPSTPSCVATSPATPSSGTSSSKRRSGPRFRTPALRRLLGEQATLGDRLLAAVSAEHAREAENRPSSAAERRRECVKSLLAGELVDHSELGYDLDAHHLGLMARGEGAAEAMRELAGRLDRRLLAVCREEEPVWACWLGGRNPLEPEEALRALRDIRPDGILITVGEPGEGLSGWRFSHRQAKAALPIAERGDRPLLRYADVTLLASIAPRRPRDRIPAPALPGAARRRPGRGQPADRPAGLLPGRVATSPPPPRRWASIAAR